MEHGVPSAKWATVNDLRAELDPFVQTLGRMPKEPELIAGGRLDLKAAIRKFGGYPRVAEALGIPYASRKFWTCPEDLRPHLDPIVEEIGHMPGEPELKARGRQDVRGAIRKFGGYRVVAQTLGYPYAGPREWSSVEDLRSHLSPIAAELGRMPTQPELLARRRSDLARAIDKFGGFPIVAAVLGYEYASLRSWRTVEDLREHLDPIVMELKTMPTAPELRRRGRTDLVSAIGKFGGFPEVAATLGYQPASRPRFGSVEELRPLLDPIAAVIGHMPGKHDLPTQDRDELLQAIRKFGGKERVATALGYSHEKRHKWEDVSELRPHLDPIVTDIGRLPGPKELAARGASYLIEAIAKFGGPIQVSDELGYDYDRLRSWQSPEDMRPDLDEIVQQLGRMPTKRELLRRGRADLSHAVQKFGGIAVVAARFGYPYSPAKFWKDVVDLRPYLDPLVFEFGRMPTSLELAASGRGDLVQAIGKFGGFPKVAKLLGYQYAGPKPWKSVADLSEHLEPLVLEFGRMPTIPELGARGRSDLINAVSKFGGMAKVAAKLGYPYESLRTWSEVEDLRPYLDPIAAEIGCMPRTPDLAARHCSFLIGPIRKFGGFSKVAEALGYAYESRRTWETVEDLRPHLDPFVAELGRMPKQPELKRSGHSWLNAWIEKFGGFPKVAMDLGYVYESFTFWNSIDDLRPELEPWVAELGRMPSKPELEARGRSDLAAAIQKFGGQLRVAEVFGYPYVFSAGVDRRRRLARLESALAQLHESHMLSAGQIMLILRHAGLLTRGHVAEVVQHLEAAPGAMDEVITQLEVLSEQEPEGEPLAAVEDRQESNLGLDVLPSQPVSEKGTPDFVPDPVDEHPEVIGSLPARRDRVTEINELRGWSAVGNLLDPSPALVGLCVTRLKIAFYGFANKVRGSLEAPLTPPSPDLLVQLRAELWESAFGEYGDLVENDLVRESCEAYVEDLAAALLLPRQEMDFVPRLYQLDGARFVAERVTSSDRPYGLLFDQPGMGKTLTTVWGLASGGAERFAIVAPLTVKRQVWILETIRQAFPDLKEERFAADLNAALALPVDGPAVAVLHYEELRRHEEIRRLAAPRDDGSPPFDAVVFDEAHEVKERLSTGTSPGPTRVGAWLLRQGARCCIGLTATPVVNELYEPVSLLHLAQGRRDTDAGKRLQSRRLRDRVDVMEYLLADSLRRLKTDVLFEIPPRQIHVHEVVPVAELLERLRAFLGGGRRSVAARLPEYRRLALEAKLDWIAGKIRAELHSTTIDGFPDPKTLVLCYNVDEISEKVHARLVAELGADRVLHVCGATPQAEREEALRRFREPAGAANGVSVLVGTVGTIGVGVTLFDPATDVTPHRVIFADLPFTWAEFEQGVDRLHRVGQKHAVRVDVPIVTFGEQLTRADGAPLESFDQWVWGWIRRKQLLADQVLDAAFDVSEYKDSAIRKAIAQALKAVEESGGAVIAPPPPEESPAAEHRRTIGRLRGMPRERAAEAFRDPAASERFLAANDASSSARLALRLVRERLGRWLDARSVVVDLGCGSNPLRDLPAARVVGIDRHGVNGGLVGDSAATGLPAGEADFVVMSLSMWGPPGDRLAYLREAKRLLRPLGKLVVVEPLQTFGGQTWQHGVARLSSVLERLGMRLAEVRAYTVDAGSGLLAFVVDNSSTPAAEDLEPADGDWSA